VNAPLSSQYTSCAESSAFLSSLFISSKYGNGGAMITPSTSLAFASLIAVDSVIGV